MAVMDLLRRLLCCFAGRADTGAPSAASPEAPDFDAIATIVFASKHKKGGGGGDDKGDKERDALLAAITKQYARVITEDVEVKGQGVCLTSDVAVLGDVRISAGGTCITGNVLVVGDVIIDGKDEQTVNGTCITGSAIVLGNVHIRGHVCVAANAFVKGDIKITGSLKTEGKLCYWGQKEICPLDPHRP